jgi:signal transduction histidine kinase
LQLEGAGPLNEKDLDFASALTNLVTVALDRYYKAKKERDKQEEEARRNLKILCHSQDRVLKLESERDLREAFVSLLIHDLITPLSIILGSAQMILRKPSESHVKPAGMIVAQTNRAGKMVTDLLDANRIRGGEKVSLIKEETNITQMVQTTLSELSVIHGDRFILNAQENVHGRVDPRGIRRIIENLCTNAIKYGSSDNPVVVDLQQTMTATVLCVRNQGNVISANDQESLFNQFKRSDSASSGTQKGWGIGLTLVRGVAEAHGGKVTVSSDAIKGTVFTVTLPR